MPGSILRSLYGTLYTRGGAGCLQSALPRVCFHKMTSLKVQTVVLWQVGASAGCPLLLLSEPGKFQEDERQPLEAWGQVGLVPGYQAWNSLCIKEMWSQEPSVKSQYKLKVLTHTSDWLTLRGEAC